MVVQMMWIGVWNAVMMPASVAASATLRDVQLVGPLCVVGVFQRLKEAEYILSFASKAVSEPGVKGQVSRCKEIVRNIINTCLSETQKLHIGTTVQGHDSSLLLDILAALRHLHPGGKPHGLASATASTSHPSEPAASTRT